MPSPRRSWIYACGAGLEDAFRAAAWASRGPVPMGTDALFHTTRFLPSVAADKADAAASDDSRGTDPPSNSETPDEIAHALSFASSREGCVRG